MSKGILPYNDTFATGGLLYYAIIALSYLLGSSIWLIIINFVVYYFTARYLYSLINTITHNSEIAVAMNLLFFIFNSLLGFGGLYPIQWGFPFLLFMIRFLKRFMDNSYKDESFIFLGLISAIGLFIEPRLFIFWILMLLALLCTNIRRRHFGRGFYQALCFIFGTLITCYIVGYFIFTEQLTTNYLSQVVGYYLFDFSIGQSNVVLSFIYQAVLILFSGLLLGFKTLSKPSNRTLRYILLLSIVFYSIYALFSQNLNSYGLLFLLPQGLILAAFYLGDISTITASKHHYRQHRSHSLPKQLFALYFTKNFLMPIALCVIVVGMFIYHNSFQIRLNQERYAIAKFITQHTEKTDAIYVFDKNTQIYTQSHRRSVSKITLPHLYTANRSNQKYLEDTLLQDNASYLVMRNDISLNSTLKKNISKRYRKVKFEESDHFTLYKNK